MGLFRTLFIIAVSYYLIRFIMRFFSRLGGAKLRSDSNGNQPSNNKRDSKNKDDNRDDLGEYVDFEEIND